MTALAALRQIARALGGEVCGRAVLAPGPGHSAKDRSLSVKLSFSNPDGFGCHSYAGDDFRLCRDFIRAKLGLRRDGWGGHRSRVPEEPSGRERGDETRIAYAVKIWNEGRDPRGTIVEKYLASRRIELDETVCGASLRFHPACPWRDEQQQIIHVPAMVAAMRQACDDRFTAVHRTRLTADGQKVDRRMLGIAAGAAIKLDPDEAVTTGLAIGEGIETVMSGRMLGFQPAWAMGSAGGLAKLPLLSGIEAVTIMTERDETGANQRATQECGERWHAAGREVFLIEPLIGNDLNDALRSAA